MVDEKISFDSFIQNEILNVPNILNYKLYHGNNKFNKRLDFKDIIYHINNFLNGNKSIRFLALPGMRGVGKTVLLYQIYEYLLKEKNIIPEDIIFFSCEKLKKIFDYNIYDFVKYYLKFHHDTGLKTLDKPIFLLVDEVQYDKDCQYRVSLL